MNIQPFVFGIAVVIIGVLVFLAILATSRRPHKFNREKYQSDFLAIETSLEKDNRASYNMALISADKLLDRALFETGVNGKTMGDRLKKSGEKFTELNSVWYAHKLRNRIAHEPGFSIEYSAARHALAVYKQALQDLGAI
ncbi:hypothetical protein IJG76_01650 [Candidatus Saccharibacteria bacterium]|nr:hypothetical protein [Candidatus Saccharibacteria bacterium]